MDHLRRFPPHNAWPSLRPFTEIPRFTLAMSSKEREEHLEALGKHYLSLDPKDEGSSAGHEKHAFAEIPRFRRDMTPEELNALAVFYYGPASANASASALDEELEVEEKAAPEEDREPEGEE